MVETFGGLFACALIGTSIAAVNGSGWWSVTSDRQILYSGGLAAVGTILLQLIK